MQDSSAVVFELVICDAPRAISSADIESSNPIIAAGVAARWSVKGSCIMSRFKNVALILAGMLAIVPAAFAHGGGGHSGGFPGGHFGGYSHFVGGHYGWHGGGRGQYWHGGRWYGRPYYGGGYWYGSPYWWSYPYGLGYYDYDYYQDPSDYTNDETTDAATAPAVPIMTAVQQKLAQLGYYHGQIDGIAGPETQKAIRLFQSTDKIPITGRVDGRTLKALQSS
jgi:Putative peptidoglycan binding domain